MKLVWRWIVAAQFHHRIWALLLLGIFCHSTVLAAGKPHATDDVLVLYDGSGPYGWIGEMNARFLLNLLGHFPQSYQMMPVESYASGDALRFRATFYFGNVYNNPLPASFLQDIMATTKPVCWFKYNLWNLSANSFTTEFGFRFDYMDSSGFPQIEYRGETFDKNQLDAELGRTTITDSNRARVVAVARQLPSSNSIPYIINGSNFWYVADIPFGYISEEDRYLIFADVLHDIIERDHPESHKAIIRLEDVAPTYDTQTLRRVADYLNSEQVPFSVAVIARYLDPHGYYEDGAAVDVRMSQSRDFVNALRFMVGRGSQLVMHGYTHQYRDVLNPYTAVSGDDYEFFRVTIDAQTNIVDYMPVPEDSVAWVQGRLNAALQEFQLAGLIPVAFEAPHYAASALDYTVFATNFLITFHRVLYFDGAGHIAGQFFPYTIERDVYGQKLLPENLGNVDPVGWYNYAPRFPADLLRAARKNRVLRDAWASAFFHPYLDLSYLQELISGIRALGYTFVPLADPIGPTITIGPESQAVTNGARVVMNVEAVGTAPLRYQWRFNNANINGATNTTFTISNAQPGNAGVYTIVVTNPLGSATSDPARLQVVAAGFSITNLSYTGGECVFYVRTQTNVIYTIQFKDDLSDPDWQFLTSLTGNGGLMRISDPVTRRQRFYQVAVQ